MFVQIKVRKIVSIILLFSLIQTSILLKPAFSSDITEKFCLATPLASKPPCEIVKNGDGTFSIITHLDVIREREKNSSLRDQWVSSELTLLISQAIRLGLSKHTLIPLIRKHIDARNSWTEFYKQGFILDEIEEIRKGEEIIGFSIPVVTSGRHVATYEYKLKDGEIEVNITKTTLEDDLKEDLLDIFARPLPDGTVSSVILRLDADVRKIFGISQETDLKDKDVLVLGCGGGMACFAAVLNGAKKAVGVDIDPNSIRTAKMFAPYIHDPMLKEGLMGIYPGIELDTAVSFVERVSRGGSFLNKLLKVEPYNLNFIGADAQDLSVFEDNSFDIVSIPFLLGQLNGITEKRDMSKVLKEAIRVLRPNGKLVIVPFIPLDAAIGIIGETQASEIFARWMRDERIDALIQLASLVDEYIKNGYGGKRLVPVPGNSGAFTIRKITDEEKPDIIKKLERLRILGAGEIAEKVQKFPDKYSFILDDPFLNDEEFWSDLKKLQETARSDKPLTEIFGIHSEDIRQSVMENYFHQFRQYMPDIINVAVKLFSEPKDAGAKFVFLGRATDPLYWTAKYLLGREMSSRLILMDFGCFSPECLKIAHANPDAFQRYLASLGLKKDDKIVIVDEFSPVHKLVPSPVFVESVGGLFKSLGYINVSTVNMAFDLTTRWPGDKEYDAMVWLSDDYNSGRTFTMNLAKGEWEYDYIDSAYSSGLHVTRNGRYFAWLSRKYFYEYLLQDERELDEKLQEVRKIHNTAGANIEVRLEQERINGIRFTDEIKLIQAKDQKAISFIAVGTDWIKGYKGENVLEYNILNPYIGAINRYCEEHGIKFIIDDDKAVSDSINLIKDSNKNARGIVLASEGAICDIEARLKEIGLEDDKNIFLASVNGENVGVDNYIRLIEILRVMIGIFRLGSIDEGDVKALQEEHPELGISYVNGRLIFIPHAEPVNYENRNIKELYRAQVSA